MLSVTSPAYQGETFQGRAFENTVATGEMTVDNGTGDTLLLTAYATGAGFLYGDGTSTGDAVDWGTTDAEMVALSAEVDPVTMLATVLWETAAESNNLGFIVYRADNEQGPFVPVSELIAGLGTSPVGRAYSFSEQLSAGHDPAAVFYRVEAIDFAGQTESFGPVASTVGAVSR